MDLERFNDIKKVESVTPSSLKYVDLMRLQKEGLIIYSLSQEDLSKMFDTPALTFEKLVQKDLQRNQSTYPHQEYGNMICQALSNAHDEDIIDDDVIDNSLSIIEADSILNLAADTTAEPEKVIETLSKSNKPKKVLRGLKKIVSKNPKQAKALLNHYIALVEEKEDAEQMNEIAEMRLSEIIKETNSPTIDSPQRGKLEGLNME